MTSPTPKLLVAVDFSDTSRRALDLALELSPRIGAEVVLVHVFEPPTSPYVEISPLVVEHIYGEVLPAARKALSELAERLGGLEAIFREGHPGQEIVAVAEQVKATMVIIGTHGRTGLSRLFLGSVAEHVVRHASMPVITVRGGDKKG